jgi:hypothetical protein
MMMNDWGMGINVYDPLSTYENLDINPEIETFVFYLQPPKEENIISGQSTISRTRPVPRSCFAS